MQKIARLHVISNRDNHAKNPQEQEPKIVAVDLQAMVS